MGKTTSKKSSVKALADKPSGKPPPRNKTLGLEMAIRFFTLEDSDETEEWEEAEIVVFHDSSFTLSKQNLVKRKLPYIDTFDDEEPIVVNTRCDLTSGVFDHLEITSPMDVE